MLTPAQQKRQQALKDKAVKYWKEVINCGMLECRVCHNFLSLDFFTPCTKKYKESGYLSYNKECQICRKNRHLHDRHFAKISLKDILSERLYAATIRAKNKNLIIDIDLIFLLELWNKQDGRCYYSNKNLSLKINDPDKVSIDRLDSSKGYTRDNIVLCRNCINYMKVDLSISDFKLLVSEINQTLNK